MNLLVLLLQAALVASNAISTLHSGSSEQCARPSKRPEWRTLSKKQKTGYLDAVKCLQMLPANGDITRAKTRFDDFQGVHISLTPNIHFVGQFLPWHRYFVWVYEHTMREECGYTGVIPYWDWTIDVDAGSFAESPIWDPVYGFGGNGVDIPGYNGPFNNLSNVVTGWKPGTGGGCITDGPFASYNLSLGPGTLDTSHCLSRAFNPSTYSILTSDQVKNVVLNQKNFSSFWHNMEGAMGEGIRLHGGGHIGVGGEMSNEYSSPGDPVFYLHHANLDRIWWDWQKADLKTRLYEITGPTTNPPRMENVTLDYILQMRFLAPSRPIRDVMDIRNKLLCYEYV